MKNINFRFSIALICLLSLMSAVGSTFAAPVRFEQVRQVVNIKPGKAGASNYAQLRLADDGVSTKTVNDDDTVTTGDDRVITETRVEIVEDDACDCPAVKVRGGGFPKWALLGLAAIPAVFLIKKGNDKTPTPTPTITPGETTTPTPTPTQTTPTPTPPTTPTPEPVPEPMTILLFGTGLAGIGMAARRKLRKNQEPEVE